MSDIVNRLREPWEYTQRGCQDEREEAADEIERLRAERNALHAALTECVEMLDWIGSSCEGYDATMQTVDEKRQWFLALLAAPKEQSNES